MTAPVPAVPTRATPATRALRKPTVLHRLEYAALRVLTSILAPFGVPRAAQIAGVIGAWGYAPFGIRRGIVERQIAAAFPEFDQARVQEVARESYRNLGRVTVEATVLATIGAAHAIPLFHECPDDWARLVAAHAQGKGVVLVAGHVGSWELAAAYMCARGLPIVGIVRGASNPLSEAYFKRTRERLGVTVVHDSEAVRRVPRLLRDGHVVGFLSDQAAVGLASTYVNFFGRPAKTPRGGAVFALRGDIPVVFVAAMRQPDGLYRLVVQDVPVTHSGDRERDVDAIMTRFTAMLERLVRAYPDQYFWQHRRWKHQPPDTPPELRQP
ncbi:MAG: lysophospholipid acyltransferase family protein [Gemmatimonadetes bacterium]|nr:lysophospholipid acyltransferase family protein [Gemmatimonadota bacterium]